MNPLSHEQIIKYLKENHGVAKSIDILPAFIPYLNTNANRKQFKASLDYLALEKLVEPGCRYEFLSWEKLNGLYPIENKTLQIQLSQTGNQYDVDTLPLATQLPVVEIHQTINESFVAPIAEAKITQPLVAPQPEPPSLPEPNTQPVTPVKSKLTAFWKKDRLPEAPQQAVANDKKADIDIHAIKETGLSPKSIVEQKMAIGDEPGKTKPVAITKPPVAEKDKVKDYFKARLAELADDDVPQTPTPVNKSQSTRDAIPQSRQFSDEKDLTTSQHTLKQDDTRPLFTPAADRTKVNDYWKARLSEPIEDSVTDGNPTTTAFTPFHKSDIENKAKKNDTPQQPEPHLPIIRVVSDDNNTNIDAVKSQPEPLAEPLAFSLDTLDDIPDNLLDLRTITPPPGTGGIETPPLAIITRTVVEPIIEPTDQALTQSAKVNVPQPGQVESKVKDYFKARLAEPIDGPVVENKRREKTFAQSNNTTEFDKPIAEIKERVDEYKKDKPLEPIEDIIAEYKSAVNSFWEKDVYATDIKKDDTKPVIDVKEDFAVQPSKVEDKPETRWHPFTEIKGEPTESTSKNPDYTGSRDKPIIPAENKWHPYVDIEDEVADTPSLKNMTSPNQDVVPNATQKKNTPANDNLNEQFAAKDNAKPAPTSETKVYQYVEEELPPAQIAPWELTDFSSLVSATTNDAEIGIDKIVTAQATTPKGDTSDKPPAWVQPKEAEEWVGLPAVKATEPVSEQIKETPTTIVRGFMEDDNRSRQTPAVSQHPLPDEPKITPSPIIRGFMETDGGKPADQNSKPQPAGFKQEPLPLVREFKEVEDEPNHATIAIPTPKPADFKTAPSPMARQLEETDEVYQTPAPKPAHSKTAPSPMARQLEEADEVYQTLAPTPADSKMVPAPMARQLEETDQIYQNPAPKPADFITAPSPIVRNFEQSYQAPAAMPKPIPTDIKTAPSPMARQLEEAENDLQQIPSKLNPGIDDFKTTPSVWPQEANEPANTPSWHTDNRSSLNSTSNAEIYKNSAIAEDLTTIPVPNAYNPPVEYTPRIIAPKPEVGVISPVQSATIPAHVSNEILALHKIVLQPAGAPDDAEKPGWAFKAAIALITLMLCAALVWYFKFRQA